MDAEKPVNPVKMWANFLTHEKLSPNDVEEKSIVPLLTLGGELAKRFPTERGFRSYKDRQRCRRLVCELAVELGIDLGGVKHRYRNKVAMGRGLLDVWNAVYKEKFGGVVGTAGWFEDKRRGVKTNTQKESK